MTYTTAAKTDKPTDWKALWISLGDDAFSKKNDSHGSDLSFNRSSRTGECGLSNDGTCLRFPIFCVGCCGEDNWVVDVAEIPVPTVFEKLFFEKVARLIQYTCDCNPEYSVEAFDWDWASFHKNILLPNIMHIQSQMQLSDTVDIADRVVYSAILCLMNGRRGPPKPGFILFSVEDLDF